MSQQVFLIGNKITLRLATLEDAELLLEWRNDPETRNASHNSERVQIEEHISWLIETLGNPHKKLFIAEEKSIPVGTVRAELSEGEWELSWTVAPNARGRGVAKKMVELLADTISKPIRAEMKSDNVASVKIAEHVGMKLNYHKNGTLYFKREKNKE